jgi:transcriptional regulator with XRE-family HTH domain
VAKTIHSARQAALIQALIAARNAAGLTQAEVARRLKRYQSYVATVEGGQRRIDVVEFLDFARAIGFQPDSVIRRIAKVRET